MVTDLQDVDLSNRPRIDRSLHDLRLGVSGQEHALGSSASKHHHTCLVRCCVLHGPLGQHDIERNVAHLQLVTGSEFAHSSGARFLASVVDHRVLARERPFGHEHDRHVQHSRGTGQTTVVIRVQMRDDHAVKPADLMPGERPEQNRPVRACVDQHVVSRVGDQDRIALADIKHSDFGPRGR